MRCRYCIAAIPDFSTQCPACGSKLPDEKRTGRKRSFDHPLPLDSVNTGAAAAGAAKSHPPSLSGRKTRLISAGGVLLCLCLCLFLVAAVAPGLLPQPVFVLLPILASPSPMPTPQVTRAPIPSATPIILARQQHTSGRFTISFPAGWLVVDQQQGSWRDLVKDMGESYNWAETLFETAAVPTGPLMRAVDPQIVDLERGRLVLFTAAEANLGAGLVTLDDIETLAAQDPAGLAALAGGLPLIGNPQEGYNFREIRTERVKVSGRGAGQVDFMAETAIRDRPVRVVVRLTFVPDGEDLYVVAFIADEIAYRHHEPLYDQIANSFNLVVK